MNKFIILVLVLVFSYGSKAEEESAHDVILKVNEQALEEELAFGNVGEPQPPLIEGDIVDAPVTRQRMEEERRVADGEASAFDALNRGKWSNGRVPYVLGSVGNYARSQIDRAIREYNEKTCVRFVPRRNENDYVIFNQGRGCFSMIGRVGGRQEISIGRGCERLGTVIHEMMHAIGFYHEQSRRDRDDHVKIYWGNISPSMKFNFNMYRQGIASTYNEPYDLKSVMHYSKYSFSINKRPTIVAKKDEGMTLGNNVGFTPIDVRQIRRHYNCGNTGPNPQPGTQPPTTNCKDISWRCHMHSHKCSSNDYVKEKCQKTCKLC